MGYTHYWNQKRDFTFDEFGQIKTRMRRWYLKNSNIIPLCGGDGLGKPEIDNEKIVFNGDAEEGQDYETFYFTRLRRNRESWEPFDKYQEEGAFEFCKTAQRPYDAAVVFCLAVAREVAPSAVEISSDGGLEVFECLSQEKELVAS